MTPNRPLPNLTEHIPPSGIRQVPRAMQMLVEIKRSGITVHLIVGP